MGEELAETSRRWAEARREGGWELRKWPETSRWAKGVGAGDTKRYVIGR